MNFPRISNHGSEVGLLGFIAGGIVVILIIAAYRGLLGGANAVDVAAFLLVLVRIVEAIQKRWEQRSVDRTTDQLAGSAPTPVPSTKMTIEGDGA